MTTRHRITTAVVVTLGFAASATPAWALPTDLTANGSEVRAGSPSVTSQAADPGSPPTLVRLSAGGGGVDWGDVGIGAGGGFAISMIAVGGALVASQRRGRRTHGTAVTS